MGGGGRGVGWAGDGGRAGPMHAHTHTRTFTCARAQTHTHTHTRTRRSYEADIDRFVSEGRAKAGDLVGQHSAQLRSQARQALGQGTVMLKNIQQKVGLPPAALGAAPGCGRGVPRGGGVRPCGCRWQGGWGAACARVWGVLGAWASNGGPVCVRAATAAAADYGSRACTSSLSCDPARPAARPWSAPRPPAPRCSPTRRMSARTPSRRPRRGGRAGDGGGTRGVSRARRPAAACARGERRRLHCARPPPR